MESAASEPSAPVAGEPISKNALKRELKNKQKEEERKRKEEEKAKKAASQTKKTAATDDEEMDPTIRFCFYCSNAILREQVEV